MVSPTITLKKLPLFNYLDRAPVLGIAFAFDDEDPEWFVGADLPVIQDQMHAACIADDVTWVAHNAAFDTRVLTRALGLPYPKHVLCTLELCCAAYPNHPGGYSLKNMSETLNLQTKKTGLGDQVMKMSPEELELYCRRDVMMCREIFQFAMKRLDPREVATAEAANRVRGLSLLVNREKIKAASQAFSALSLSETLALQEVLEDPEGEAVGRDDSGVPKSLKPAVLKRLLLDHLGYETRSITMRKNNPEKLRQNAPAQSALSHAERANKAFTQSRKAKLFTSCDEVPMELGYYRATATGRYSSPSVGKGLNLLAMNKRDPVVSKAMREIFSLPDHLCFVSADEMNVEHRVQALIMGAEHSRLLFELDVMTDPYSAFWFACTGQRVSKKDPARQIAKAAVLSLGFMVGIQTWMSMLALSLADPTFKVALADLEKICVEQRWSKPKDQWLLAAQTKLRCADAVATVAYHTRELFHKVHPEFKIVTLWLERTVHQLAACGTQAQADRVLDSAYSSHSAPKREMIDVSWDPSYEGSTVRVNCGGHWQPTVTWRDLALRPTKFNGVAMTFMSGRKGFRPLTKNILAGTITQSAARNASVQAKALLADRGYTHIMSVHDELKLIVPRTVNAVKKARQDMLEVLGPNGELAKHWKWSVVIDPHDITCSRTLHEVHQDAAWWDNPDLETLP
jgi:hypothetical protein